MRADWLCPVWQSLHIDALISLRCATIALPVAAADRQRVLAVSVLVCERVLARLDGRGGNSLSPDSERVLGAVPEAAQWAGRFTSQVGPRLAAFRRQSAPDAVRYAVEGAAHALIPDPDVLLRRMLVGVNRHLRGVDRQPSIWCRGRRRRLGGSMPTNRSGERRLTTHLGPEPQLDRRICAHTGKHERDLKSTPLRRLAICNRERQTQMGARSPRGRLSRSYRGAPVEQWRAAGP